MRLIKARAGRYASAWAAHNAFGGVRPLALQFVVYSCSTADRLPVLSKPARHCPW
jgi:hypothetical protein